MNNGRVVQVATDKKKGKGKSKAITPVLADDLEQSTSKEVVASDSYGVDFSSHSTVQVPYKPPANNAQPSNPLNLQVSPDSVIIPYALPQDNSQKPSGQAPNQNSQPSSSFDVQSSQDTVHDVSCTQSELKKKREK